MTDIEKVIKGLECCAKCESCAGNCPYDDDDDNCEKCTSKLANDALELLKTQQPTIALLKEQEARELTIDEWQEWKKNQKRDPICVLWENDTSPIWILNPNAVHEPALLMGKLKLFTGKPTFEQCKEVKWR